MTRLILLLAAACVLLVIETTLLDASHWGLSRGGFVWLLLPLFAALPEAAYGVAGAALTGLLLEAFSGLPTGAALGLSVAAHAGLRTALPDSLLRTTTGRAVTCGGTVLCLSLLTAAPAGSALRSGLAAALLVLVVTLLPALRTRAAITFRDKLKAPASAS